MDRGGIRSPLGGSGQRDSLVGVAVRIFKQVLLHGELVDAGQRTIDEFFLDGAVFQTSDHDVRMMRHRVFTPAGFVAMGNVRGAEHVGAELQRAVHKPCIGHFAQVNALGADAGLRINRREGPPVGHDNALKAERLAEVIHGHGVELHVNGVGDAAAAAVGHNPFSAASQRGLPADHPVVEVLRHRAGIAEVAVAAAADPVLDAGCEAGIFQTLDFLIHDVRDVLGVLAVLRADFVRVGLEGHVHADRLHRLTVVVRQIVCQLRIIRGAEGDVGLVDVAAERIVLTVGGEDHRDAQTLRFSLRLQVVQGVGDGDRGAVQIEQQAGHLELFDDVTGVFQISVDAQQSADLFHVVHLGDQVGNALVIRQTPVFVDVQLAVLIQILELQAVNLQNGGDAFDIRQASLSGRFVRLDQCVIARFCEQLGFRRTLCGCGLFLSKGSRDHGQHHEDCQNQGQLFLHTRYPFPYNVDHIRDPLSFEMLSS